MWINKKLNSGKNLKTGIPDESIPHTWIGVMGQKKVVDPAFTSNIPTWYGGTPPIHTINATHVLHNIPIIAYIQGWC